MPEYEKFREDSRAKLSAGISMGHTPTGAQTILKLVELPSPPFRLVMGPHMLSKLIQKLSSDIEEYKLYEDIWKSSTENSYQKQFKF